MELTPALTMKHRKKNKILSRNRSQRRSLVRGLTSDLLRHGSIVTTRPKAQELRRYFEPLLTRARADVTLQTRRYLRGQLRAPADVDHLVRAAQIHLHRPGGYLRITRLPTKRRDDATMVRVDILGEDVVT